VRDTLAIFITATDIGGVDIGYSLTKNVARYSLWWSARRIRQRARAVRLESGGRKRPDRQPDSDLRRKTWPSSV
jgi:hypothetical protein